METELEISTSENTEVNKPCWESYICEVGYKTTSECCSGFLQQIPARRDKNTMKRIEEVATIHKRNFELGLWYKRKE